MSKTYSRYRDAEENMLKMEVSRNIAWKKEIELCGGFERYLDFSVAWEANRMVKSIFRGRYRGGADTEQAIYTVIAEARVAMEQLINALLADQSRRFSEYREIQS